MFSFNRKKKALPSQSIEHDVMDGILDAAAGSSPLVNKRKKRIGIIGAGSAGILSLVHFCTWLDDEWEVYSIHNPEKKILGIGESTNGEFVALLQRGCHFTLGLDKDMDRLDATVKFGSKFMGWREHSWINPLLDGNTAIHFNNFNFRDFCYERLEKLWPNQFRVLEGDVKSLTDCGDKVVVDVDGVGHDFDYVVDCMGFPSDFNDGYTLSECSPVNRCQIHSVEDYEFEPFTDHIATANGWMFGVPLQSRKTYGYMYNDKITSKEEAQADMKQMLGVDELDDKEYVFKCYYANELINGRIFKNGNKALFFEPLVANSIFIYTHAVRLMFDYMMGGQDAESANASFIESVHQMEDIISYYYQGGSNYDTPFWDFATRHCRDRMVKRDEFNALMANYKELKHRGLLQTGPTYGVRPLTWEIIDEQLGYGYIDDASAFNPMVV